MMGKGGGGGGRVTVRAQSMCDKFQLQSQNNIQGIELNKKEKKHTMLHQFTGEKING